MIEWARKMWKKYAEVINYLIFGVLATLLNIVLYAVFQALFGYEAANSWGNVLDNIICILFAYGTNRTWVFASKTHGKAAWQEFGKFVTCRLGTMVLDVIIMFVGGNVMGPALIAPAYLGLWGTGVKVFSNGIVIVLNYVFSKLIIFKKQS
ncbi:MAG: GtrA family protein [Faecalibacterium sp.]|nr:GtrA family protein [Faecalibacterium sp.]